MDIERVRAKRPLPSSKNSNFQNEDKSKTFSEENEFSLHRNEKSMAGSALSLNLTQMGQLGNGLSPATHNA